MHGFKLQITPQDVANFHKSQPRHILQLQCLKITRKCNLTHLIAAAAQQVQTQRTHVYVWILVKHHSEVKITVHTHKS